ncbi:MAG: barstar family protein [Lachnospiraceae bacterium]|nr:barstar family protein [Lachnospiraceae bacterium]
MRTVTLDFGACSGKEEIQAYLKEAFGFPEHYGNNLDAFFDCLTDVDEDIKIVIKEDPEGALREPLEDPDWPYGGNRKQNYLKAVRRVIEDAAEENSHLHI